VVVGGEADEVADERPDGRAAAPARRSVAGTASYLLGHLVCQLEDLVVDEEEAGEAVALHQGQLERVGEAQEL